MILGTICARKGSQGIPGKNTRHMNGAPLVIYTIIQALQCKTLDKVIVSTDDEQVAKLAHGYGIEVQEQPKVFADKGENKWGLFRHIAQENPCDILVDLDICCPLRDVNDIIACVDKLKGGKFEVVATAYTAERNPYFNMVKTLQNGQAQVVAGKSFPFTRRQDAPEVYSLSPAVFAIHSYALDYYEHWSQAWMGIVEIPRERAWDVDNELDWQIVEWLQKKAMNE